ncbi:glycosyltransferase [Maridesulfovibrio sp.]|uniref:glycosyltransferase family 2 protein n=1 Tax=Maridesulfovibrio sp. TaxID=2795000 RepID=UPI002A18AF4D|nr:glycosyltransferase [Maridesulfovibrio sp.]
METSSENGFWDEMNPQIRRRLLMGSVGSTHLLGTGIRSLESDSGLGAELLFAAYAANPLDGNLARSILNLETAPGFFSGPALTCLRHVAAAWVRPENLSYFLRITARRDNDKIRHYIESCLEKEPGNLFWLQQGLIHAGASSDFRYGLKLLSMEQHEAVRPAVNAARAFFRLMNTDLQEAADLLEDVSAVFGETETAQLIASCSLKMGDRNAAIRSLAACVQKQPWRVSETLRLHDLARGLDSEKRPLPGRTAILLYSYNKAEELDSTLKSLRNSELYESRIFVLDNGSTDETANVMDRWQQAFGEQMARIDLPVNIGAAAARNWLMNLLEVRECDFALYLDDDVEVEQDWLSRFGTAVAAYPDAGVWGCRVVSQSSPAVMQSVDLHIVQPSGEEGNGPEVDLTRISPNPFRVSDLHHQTLDAGYFAFMRPCASVTGCCHLFSTRKLLDNEGFSLFLSPSQYDDMEHDLRSCLKGQFAVYQGHLRILHRKNTGNASHVSVEQEGNALGNKYKMQAMHPRSEILRIMADEESLLRSDIEKKTQYLLDAGLIGSKV